MDAALNDVSILMFEDCSCKSVGRIALDPLYIEDMDAGLEGSSDIWFGMKAARALLYIVK